MKRVAGLLKSSYASLIFVFLYAPIVVMVVYSFNASGSRGKWSGFTLAWYRTLLEDAVIIDALRNTIIIALISAAAATVLGTLAAVGMHYMGKKLYNIMLNVTYLPVLNPDIVTGVSLFVFFTFFAVLGVRKGFMTLLLAHITFNTPYVILSVLPRLKQMNRHMVEAAQDLGANTGQTLRKVIIPEIKPGVLNGFLLAITMSIDDFVISYFSTNNVNTISLAIYNATRRGVNPSFNALSALMFVVVLSMLLFINIRAAPKRREPAASYQKLRSKGSNR